MFDAMLAETVTIRGDGGDEIEAYLARPMREGPGSAAWWSWFGRYLS